MSGRIPRAEAEARMRLLVHRLNLVLGSEPIGTVQLSAAGALFIAMTTGYAREAFATRDVAAIAFMRGEIRAIDRSAGRDLERQDRSAGRSGPVSGEDEVTPPPRKRPRTLAQTSSAVVQEAIPQPELSAGDAGDQETLGDPRRDDPHPGAGELRLHLVDVHEQDHDGREGGPGRARGQHHLPHPAEGVQPPARRGATGGEGRAHRSPRPSPARGPPQPQEEPGAGGATARPPASDQTDLPTPPSAPLAATLDKALEQLMHRLRPSQRQRRPPPRRGHERPALEP